jgi:hypothetical protein
MYDLRFSRSSRCRDSAIKQANFRVPYPGRSSTSVILPRDDHIVKCVMQRAAEFQGHAPLSSIEALRVYRLREGSVAQASLRQGALPTIIIPIGYHRSHLYEQWDGVPKGFH